MDLAFACLSVLAGAAFLCTGGFLAALAGTALIMTFFAASTCQGGRAPHRRAVR